MKETLEALERSIERTTELLRERNSPKLRTDLLLLTNLLINLRASLLQD